MFARHIQNIILLVIIFCSCRENRVSQVNPPERTNNEIKYAEHFYLEKHDNYTKLVLIDPWQKSEGVRFNYFLTRRGSKTNINADSSEIITVPVRKVILMSTTYLPMVSILGDEESIKGVSGTGFIFDNKIRSRVSEGLIHDVGYEENLNKELIFRLAPELIIAYGVGSEAAGNFRKLQESGIKIFFNADYLENSPLGRAEWIKVFGLLFGKEKRADSVFNILENNYKEIKSYVNSRVDSRPSVMLGLPYRDSWFISPGNSFIGNLIEDAGGNYIWKDMKADFSLPMSFENVYINASKADFWLNTGNAQRLDDIISVDPRLAYFNSVQKGNLFNNNKRISEGGGNDFWESGILHPDIILKDIASILHPGLYPDYEPFYYKKLK